MEKKRTPRLRFRGFTDDWEQRKLGELATFTKGAGYSKSDLKESGTPVVLYGRLYTKYETVIRDVDTFVDAKDGSIYSRGGEVVVPASGETAEDIAIASTLEKSGILIGGDLNVIHPCNRLEPVFLAISISNGEPHVEMARRAQGKSVVHLHNEDLSRIELQYPEIAEQQKISQCFLNLDHLITLHQRKYDMLKKVKKAMFEKMFPKNGKRVPEIRFAGFTDDWEQRKLSNIADIVGGGTPSTSNPDYWDGDIDWYTPAEIGEQIFANGSVRKITKDGLNHSSAKILPAHKTVLFTSRAGIGSMAILQRLAATNQGFQSLVCHDDIDPYFVFSMGDSIKTKAERVAAGSTFAEISGKKLGDLELMFPSTDEQKAIGNYFKNLDNLITLHQRKLEKLNKLKKSMLEEIFV